MFYYIMFSNYSTEMFFFTLCSLISHFILTLRISKNVQQLMFDKTLGPE